MTWTQFKAWLGALKRKREGERPSPDSWTVHDPWFAEQHQRDRTERGGW